MSREIVEVRNFEVRRSTTAEESRKHPFFISHVGWCVSVGGNYECIRPRSRNQVINGEPTNDCANMTCAWCQTPMGYVHGHAACFDGSCAMFGLNQAECCDGESVSVCETSTTQVAARPKAPTQ